MNWLNIAGIAWVGVTGVVSIWNRMTISQIKTDKDKFVTRPEINDIAAYIATHADTLQKQGTRLVKNEKKLTALEDKFTDIEKKASSITSCKRKLNTVEKSLSLAVEGCAVQISGLAEQLSSMESMYHTQIEDLLTAVQHIQGAVQQIDAHVTGIENDRDIQQFAPDDDMDELEEALTHLPIINIDTADIQMGHHHEHETT